MPLFGTDGVRGVAGVDLTEDLALNLAVAAARVLTNLGEFAGHRPRAIIGQDSRASGSYLESAITKGLAQSGVDVIQVGVIPTPAISFLVKDQGADLGVMISASHNPASDNGIKFFASNGMKLADSIEAQIESELGTPATPSEIGSVALDSQAIERYINFLLTTNSQNLSGVRIVVDCANGAASKVAPEVLRRAGAEVIAISNQPDGFNINRDCGSTHLTALRARVLAEGADFGFAHDGDADRVLAVDHLGEVVDGDQILGILAQRLVLPTKSVVGTVMTNLGLINALRDLGIGFVATPVGDRYVLERMLAEGHSLGGEQSGHIIMREFATTGDGVLTALHLSAAVVESGKPLNKLAGFMARYPQVLINVAEVAKDQLASNQRITAEVRAIESELGERGRVLLRASGTEPLIRVMVEAVSDDLAKELANRLAALVKSELSVKG